MSPTQFQSTRNTPRLKLDLFAHCATTHSCLLPRRTRASHHFPISHSWEGNPAFQDRTLGQAPVLALLKVPVLPPMPVTALQVGPIQVRAIQLWFGLSPV